MRAAVLASLAILVSARTASATPYETFIDITDQSELEDLLAAQDISQDTYDELLDLLNRGIDLSTADRAELYSLPNLTYEDVDKLIEYRKLQQGVIRDPAELVGANVLTEEKLLAISSFLVITSTKKNPLAAHGWVRGITRVSHRDKILPPLSLRARATAAKHLQVGIALTTTRLRVGEPVFDPNRNALIAEKQGLQAHVPKGFVKWETDELSVIAGSYRAGFAQRLVFDNSSQYSPNGLYHDDELTYAVDLDRECRESAGELATSPCAGANASKYVTPDFKWRNGLFGVGAGIKKLELPTGWLQAFGWASASRRSIYQYELVIRDPNVAATCQDPHDDDDPACKAPTVYVRPEGNLLDPTSSFSFVTLPNVFMEKLAGANVTYYADRRSSVGATVYGATETNLVDGVSLDFQEWSRYPTGRTFGAAGANFTFGQKWLDIFGEAALSYDKNVTSPGPPLTTGGGGPAGILRVTATRGKEELEAVVRYYSIDFANPYARPISQSDEFDGQRARDELGVRLRYLNNDKRITLRALVDVWVPPSTLKDDTIPTQPKLDSYVRGDVRTTDDLRLGLWVRFQDKDLKRGGHDQCFEVSTETSETGDPVPCAGRQLTTIARARLQVDRALALTVMLEHQLLDDDGASETAFRSDIAAWLIGTWNPSKDLRMRLRMRYLDEAFEDNTYLERSFSGLVDAAIKVRARDTLRVRVDTKLWMDDRASTQLRVPNPELQLWLSYEARL